MRRTVPTPQDRIARLLTALTGLALLASGALAADLGRAHMTLCGSGEQAHCAWCIAAVGLALGGSAALALAARRTAALVRFAR